MKQIILASGSPRRKKLLEQIGLTFDVVPSEYDESQAPEMPPEQLVQFLSERKAETVAKQHPDALIISADTVVVFEGEILGKAHHAERSKEMLHKLNGKTHDMVTGFTVLDAASGKKVTRSVGTRLRFRKLSEEEIDAYVALGESFDTAGGYNIGGRGAVLFDRIEGDYYNIVGLPLPALAEVLREFGVDVFS